MNTLNKEEEKSLQRATQSYGLKQFYSSPAFSAPLCKNVTVIFGNSTLRISRVSSFLSFEISHCFPSTMKQSKMSEVILHLVSVEKGTNKHLPASREPKK